MMVMMMTMITNVTNYVLEAANVLLLLLMLLTSGCAPGSISSLDDISFSPMAQSLSKQGSDVSVLSNGIIFMDSEAARSSEVR